MRKVVVVLALVTFGCASSPSRGSLESTLSSQLATVQRQLESALERNTALSEELASAREVIARFQGSEPTVLMSKLRLCEENNEKEFRAGFAEGRLYVLESVEVSGTPFVKNGVIFDDYFYHFEVRVNDRPMFKVTVQTERQEGSFGQALAAISDLANALPVRGKAGK